MWRPLDRIPVFAKAGGIIPMQELHPGADVNGLDNPKTLRVLVFPGADGSFTLREDDGSIPDARRAHVADTVMTFDWRADGDCGDSRFVIAPVAGACDAIPDHRDWTIVFRGVAPAGQHEVQVDGFENDVAYDERTLSLSVTVREVPSDASLTITVQGGLSIAQNPVNQDAFEVLLHAEMPYLAKERASQAIRNHGVHAIGELHALEEAPKFIDNLFVGSGMPDTVIRALEEVLLRS